MTEVTEERGIVATEPPVTAPEQEETRRGNAATLIASVTLIALIAALAAGYLLWLQITQKQAALESRLTAEEQSVNQLLSTSESAKDNTASLQQQLTVFAEQTANDLKQLKQHGNSVDEHLNNLDQRLQEKRGTEWLVAESRHLIAIASYQAQLNYNVKAALSALESADQRLREVDDPTLLKVRQALSDEMTALRSVATVDTPGIALLLAQLEQQVANLPLARDEEASAPRETDNSVAQEEPSAVARFFLKVWSDIKGLVTIRRYNAPEGSPLMTPEQRLYLQQNLRLKLEIARLALLQRDTQTFRNTLATTRQWLEQYFDTNAPTTAAMLASLAPFTTLELQPELPEVGTALRLLDSWQALHKGRAEAESPAKGRTTAS